MTMRGPHATRVDALVTAVLEGPGVTDRAMRASAAGAGGDLSPELAPYLALVRDASYRVADSDIETLRSAGHSEEVIFELTVAAALGAAMVSRDAGLRALRGES